MLADKLQNLICYFKVVAFSFTTNRKRRQFYIYNFINIRWFCLILSRFISERTTLRSLYAISRPSVVCCLSVVCLSVTLAHPTQAVELFGNFFHHTIAQGLYFSGAKNRWLGTPLSPWNLRLKWPTPFKTAQFRPISAHSASTVISSEKSSISTYRKSTTCFPTSHRWTVYVTPKSPKGGTKTRYRCLCQ